MTDSFPSAGGAGVLLFDEDFDLPPAPPRSLEPEVIEPLFTGAELAAAREDAARDGRDAALAEIETSARTAARRALAAIAEQIAAAREESTAIAEQSAEAVARLLLDCFATAFPALSVRHGPGEAAAMLRQILPVLHREPRIAVRLGPHAVAAVREEIEALDPDLAARIQLIPTDAMTANDVRISWENGSAVRDTNALWGQIENILAPAGLLSPKRTAKEHALAD